MNTKYILVKEITDTDPVIEKTDIKKSRLYVYCSQDAHKRFKKHCDSEGRVMSVTLANLINEYLEKYNA